MYRNIRYYGVIYGIFHTFVQNLIHFERDVAKAWREEREKDK